MTNFWHPFADMAALEESGSVVLVRGEGSHVWDDAGNRYLDATAGLWFANVGYGRTEIAEAVAEQLRRLPAHSTFGDLTNRPAEDLADRISGIAPVADSKVFFTSGGSDSVDTATKMARRYWQLKGEPDRTILIKRERAYHGMHTAGTSLAGIPANVTGYGDLLGDVVQIPWDDADALAATIEQVGAGRVAAFFCEPVMGAGGVFPPPEGYLRQAREACRSTGVLFVADEVITGFARVGEWFASTRFDLEPDLLTCAKGITSGYLPMGAVLVAPWVAEPFWAPGAGMFRHGYTYSGHAAVAAAAMANLSIIENEDLRSRARDLEARLRDGLASLADEPPVTEIRAGTGVLGAVQLDPDRIAADPSLPARAVTACRNKGVITRALATGALQVSPALVLEETDLEELIDGLRAGLAEL